MSESIGVERKGPLVRSSPPVAFEFELGSCQRWTDADTDAMAVNIGRHFLSEGIELA